MASTQSTIRIVPTGHPKRVKSELMRQRLRAAGWFLVLALVRPRDLHTDPVARDWRRFCTALARAGLKRRPHQGPISLLQTIRAERPDLADQAEAIIDLYVGLRYRGQDDEAARTTFHRAVRRFTPPPAAG